MIPFAILSGSIERRTKSGSWRTEKEIRILELSPDSFTFRLADLLPPLEEGEAERIVLHFFRFEEYGYREIVLLGEGASEPPCYKTELLPGEFFTVYRIVTEVPDYRDCAAALSKEYLRYISLKLDEDEAGLSKALTGYPAELEQKYPDSFAEQKKKWFQSLPGRTADKMTAAYELGIELDCPKRYKQYEALTLSEFQAFFLRENYPAASLFAGKTVRYLYIGNQYCHLLFPEEKQLFSLLEKARRESLKPVLMFSYCKETHILQTRQLLDKLDAWCGERETMLELVINDWGMPGMIREAGYRCFSLTLGCLLAKQRRDTRIEYKKGAKTEHQTCPSGSLAADFYREYLKEHFGIVRVSCQSGSITPDAEPKRCNWDQVTLHLPFFQMNTSQLCPLLAYLKTGSRGRQLAAEHCRFECQEYVFLYPEFLNMVGKYNSLFGYDQTILQEEEKLKAWISQGVDRLAVGFL